MDTETTNLDLGGYKPTFTTLDFVPRPEAEKILENIAGVRSGRQVDNSFLVVSGMAGMGKTWILRYIQKQCEIDPQNKTQKPVYAVYFDLEAAEFNSNADELVKKLAELLIEQVKPTADDIDIARLAKVAEQGDIETFFSVVEDLSEIAVIVFLLDTAEYVEQKLWYKLEASLIERLLLLNSVIFVVAGRRKFPRWRTFEVRDRLDQTDLEPFTDDQLQAQLKKILPKSRISSLSKIIHNLTNGTPWLNYLIAEEVCQQKGQQDNDQEAADAVALPILKFYERVITDRIHEDRRDAFDRILPFRRYRVKALKHMLTYRVERGRKLEDTELFWLLQDLKDDTDIVWWNRDTSTYMTDPTARFVLQQRVRLSNKTQYIDQHQACDAFYLQQAEEFFEFNAEFLLEILYHRACIARAAGRTDKLQDDLKDVLAFVENEDYFESRFTLYNQIAVDVELQRLLPENIYHWLRDTLKPNRSNEEQ